MLDELNHRNGSFCPPNALLSRKQGGLAIVVRHMCALALKDYMERQWLDGITIPFELFCKLGLLRRFVHCWTVRGTHSTVCCERTCEHTMMEIMHTRRDTSIRL